MMSASDAAPGAMAPEVSTMSGRTAEHEQLLRLAAERMPILFRIMKLVGKRLIAEYAPEVRKIGEGQFRALHVLCDAGTLQVGELAARSGVGDPTMSKMLKSLEHHGLIERRTDPENRRTVWVNPTAKGRALYDEMQAHFNRGLKHVLRGLTSEQLRDLLRTMEHLDHLLVSSGADRRTDAEN